ncbi:MAG: Jag N-terminal domain-containing protein [Desulfobacterales bacterium]|nr:MAG: Jag N-terminal domain-containing protein [Desulfobacterales bacterium]
MTSLEFEGKNVEKAVKKACEELEMAEDQLDYDVVSYGSSGIFGLAGTKKAKIRVRLSEETTESMTESIATGREDVLSNAPPLPNKDLQTEAMVTEGQLYSFPEDPMDLGKNVLQRIIDSITTDAKITVEEDSDRILFNVVGGNAAILIGKRGQTLEAIQSLVEKIVNKRNENKIRVQIDIEGYLENRRGNLEKLAERLAEKSKRIRRPVTIGQMSAHDRRIIHLALKNDPEVRTLSVGEGFLKKLLIIPKKYNNRKHRYQ